MIHHRTIALLLLVVGAAIVGCRTKPPGQSQTAPRVVVARPISAPVRDYFEYNGYLDTTEMVEVRARAKGLLTAIHFTEGTEIKKGDPLYDIDQREYITAEKKAIAGSKSESERSQLGCVRLAEAEPNVPTRRASPA